MTRTTITFGVSAAFDDAERQALKLAALLAHTYGNSGEAFRALSAEAQDTYLWLAADLANELVRTLEVARGEVTQ